MTNGPGLEGGTRGYGDQIIVLLRSTVSNAVGARAAAQQPLLKMYGGKDGRSGRDGRRMNMLVATGQGRCMDGVQFIGLVT